MLQDVVVPSNFGRLFHHWQRGKHIVVERVVTVGNERMINKVLFTCDEARQLLDLSAKTLGINVIIDLSVQDPRIDFWSLGSTIKICR